MDLIYNLLKDNSSVFSSVGAIVTIIACVITIIAASIGIKTFRFMKEDKYIARIVGIIKAKEEEIVSYEEQAKYFKDKNNFLAIR